MSWFECLPDEILENIFVYLDPISLASCEEVCSRWRNIVSELWHVVAQRSSVEGFCLDAFGCGLTFCEPVDFVRRVSLLKSSLSTLKAVDTTLAHRSFPLCTGNVTGMAGRLLCGKHLILLSAKPVKCRQLRVVDITDGRLVKSVDSLGVYQAALVGYWTRSESGRPILGGVVLAQKQTQRTNSCDLMLIGSLLGNELSHRLVTVRTDLRSCHYSVRVFDRTLVVSFCGGDSFQTQLCVYSIVPTAPFEGGGADLVPIHRITLPEQVWRIEMKQADTLALVCRNKLLFLDLTDGDPVVTTVYSDPNLPKTRLFLSDRYAMFASGYGHEPTKIIPLNDSGCIYLDKLNWRVLSFRSVSLGSVIICDNADEGYFNILYLDAIEPVVKTVSHPEIDTSNCDFCGIHFNAASRLGSLLLECVFRDYVSNLCHVVTIRLADVIS